MSGKLRERITRKFGALLNDRERREDGGMADPADAWKARRGLPTSSGALNHMADKDAGFCEDVRLEREPFWWPDFDCGGGEYRQVIHGHDH